MASGMGGQRWAFRGYLPPDAPSRERVLKELELVSSRDGAAQVFIETPYRNDAMVASAVRALSPETIFCAAVGLSEPSERVLMMNVAKWRSAIPVLGKTPAVFLLLAHASKKGTSLPPGHSRDGKSRFPPEYGKH
jgi:16S rRNA (cytidine1402-2'-O)-methyltransferase